MGPEKVLKFKFLFFRSWKVLKFDIGDEKVLIFVSCGPEKNRPSNISVMRFPWMSRSCERWQCKWHYLVLKWQKVLEYLLSWSEQQQYLFQLALTVSCFPITVDLEGHKWYYNRSLLVRISSAERSWNSILPFEWEPWNRPLKQKWKY